MSIGLHNLEVEPTFLAVKSSISWVAFAVVAVQFVIAVTMDARIGCTFVDIWRNKESD
jgi:uncharacterized membrane protein YidH (DUF202 family)